MLARDVLADDEIRGYTIPRGSICAIVPLLVHLHPDYWDDPAVFKPDRFQSFDFKHNPAFMPFSGGARPCTGRNLVFQQSLYILARLLQRFDFTLAPTYDYSDLFLGTLGSREEIRMSVKAARSPRRPGTASKSSGNHPEPRG